MDKMQLWHKRKTIGLGQKGELCTLGIGLDKSKKQPAQPTPKIGSDPKPVAEHERHGHIHGLRARYLRWEKCFRKIKICSNLFATKTKNSKALNK